MTDQPKPLRVILKVQNNLLYARRVESGLSQVALSEIIGVSMNTYNALENMRTDPLGKTGPRDVTKKLLEYYNCEFEDLWPDVVRRVTTPVAVRELNADELQLLLPQHDVSLLPSPAELCEKKEKLDDINSAMSELTERECDIIMGHVHDVRDTEMAEQHGVSPTRIGDIREKALVKVRQRIWRNRNWAETPGSKGLDLISLILGCLRHSKESCSKMNLGGDQYALSSKEIADTIGLGTTANMANRVLKLMEERNQVDRVPVGKWVLAEDRT